MKTNELANPMPRRNCCFITAAYCANWHATGEDPETLKVLKASAQSDEDQGVRQSALRELARNWKDAPETLTILKASD